MAFTLPDLPYAHDALEPVIDSQTMQIHHGKHHNAYVTNLNAAIEELSVPDCVNELISDLTKIPEGKRTAVRTRGEGSGPPSRPQNPIANLQMLSRSPNCRQMQRL